MPPLRLVAETFGQELEEGFDRIRRELDVPLGFPEAVRAEAAEVAAAGPRVPPGGVASVADRTDLPLITIDPATSTDLDQAFAAETIDGGYRVWYAIADVASFVHPDTELDREAQQRGVTLYSPDQRASLHPEAINENAASLLPNTVKPAVLWRIDLDEDGNQHSAHVERAMVQSTAKLSYQQAQTLIDSGDGPASLALLREIGMHRQRLEAERGAVSLQLPAQEISRLADGDYELHFDRSLPVEGWNAQISLLTGMAAGEIMADVGHGLLRTLPPLDDRIVGEVRHAAKGLDIDWPDGVSYPDRVRTLDPNNPREAALLTRAARSFRGAGYDAFVDGDLPAQPLHGAIAAIYAHVTAPLRRVCDRFANELLLAACADMAPPSWALEALDALPEIMGQARQRDRSLERATVDFVEAVALRSKVGQVFDGCVLSHRRRGASVQLKNPPVLANIDTKPPVGTLIRLELTAVDVTARSIEFESPDQDE